jgi:hypothetical protein
VERVIQSPIRQPAHVGTISATCNSAATCQNWTGAKGNIGDEFHSSTGRGRFSFAPGTTRLLDLGDPGVPNTCTGNVEAIGAGKCPTCCH